MRCPRPRRSSSLYCVAAILLFAASAVRADVYGYVDENGVPHFSDRQLTSRYKLFKKDPPQVKTFPGSTLVIINVPGSAPRRPARAGVNPAYRKQFEPLVATVARAPPKKMANNFVYVEVPAGKEMQPQHLWINGSLYDVKVETTVSPVIMNHSMYPSQKADTLVRGTANKVLQLIPVPTTSTFNASKSAAKKMKSHQLVLHTIENGKNCYYYLDRIKNLEPVALQ